MDSLIWMWENTCWFVDTLWQPGMLWEWVRPLVIWGQVFVFIYFLLVASIGRRLKLRRKYVDFLDGIFQFAAYTLSEEEEEEEEVKEEVRGSDSSEEESVVICPESPRAGPISPQGTFRLDDPMAYLAAGMRAVVQDCVSKSTTVAELHTWNLLSRTKRRRYFQKSPPLTIFWIFGFLFRWVILMPVRILLLAVSLSTLILLCSFVGVLPTSDFKRRLNARVVTWCFDFVAGSLSFVGRFHNPENRPSHGIAVANHTSPIDSMILATDQCYDMVGQKTRGFLGVFMSALSRSSTHIWFERSEARERSKVTQIIQEHARDPNKPPILIFPEGICLNNTAVMQFKKGAFEIESVIHPIAIRFDLRYGDPYWWQNSFLVYIFHMMTSWAIICDVWYLPPAYRQPSETAAAFANRVRAQIAHAGGLVELAWDGNVKIAKDSDRWRAKEGQWREKQQQEYARRFNGRVKEEEARREEEDGRKEEEKKEERREDEESRIEEKEEGRREDEESRIEEKEEGRREDEESRIEEKEEGRRGKEVERRREDEEVERGEEEEEEGRIKEEVERRKDEKRVRGEDEESRIEEKEEGRRGKEVERRREDEEVEEGRIKEEVERRKDEKRVRGEHVEERREDKERREEGRREKDEIKIEE